MKFVPLTGPRLRIPTLRHSWWISWPPSLVTCRLLRKWRHQLFKISNRFQFLDAFCRQHIWFQTPACVRVCSWLLPKTWASAWWSIGAKMTWRTGEFLILSSHQTLLGFIRIFSTMFWSLSLVSLKEWADKEADEQLGLVRYVLKRSRRNEKARSAPHLWCYAL